MRNLPIACLLLSVVFMPAMRSMGGEPNADVSRVLKSGELPPDRRLEKPRTLRDAYHPWTPATTKEAWEIQARQIRERVLVSNGLWPLPPRQPLKPVVHGKIDRGDYTIEKVYFASHPGHYVTGNLYRPKGVSGKIPGVLCPHGHWRDARFYDAGEANAKKIVAAGGEKYMSGARHHVQARMVQLTRMGCIVFHYDMVGYSDSGQIAHRAGFTDAEAGLQLQNFMGLQTFNSIRALDFLESLPEVDAKRIGVTGASGGGTQTFMLCAVDPRPTVAFPAVMVSTAMQGGCVCENAEYLRIGINNIALSAVFAPKPLALSGANVWTVDIETKGLPELKQVYTLYGKANLVHAKAFPRFGHNYNQVSREVMYDWFNRHLKLGLDSPVRHQDYWPAGRDELTVFDEKHPLPGDARSASQLREYLTKTTDAQFQKLVPKNAEGVAEYKRVVGAAARVMLDDGVPSAKSVTTTSVTSSKLGNVTLTKGLASRKGDGEAVPFVTLRPQTFQGAAVLWIDGRGKSHLFDQHGRPNAAVVKLLKAGMMVASADLFLTGEFVKAGQKPQYIKVDSNYQGLTFGYNRPVLSNRVRDVLTAIGLLAGDKGIKSIQLVGTGAAGPWVLLAGGLAGEQVSRTVADAGSFRFTGITETTDPMFLPGALKYGGLGGLAALAAPTKLTVMGAKEIDRRGRRTLEQVYSAANGKLSLRDGSLTSRAVVETLLD